MKAKCRAYGKIGDLPVPYPITIARPRYPVMGMVAWPGEPRGQHDAGPDSRVWAGLALICLMGSSGLESGWQVWTGRSLAKFAM